MITDTEKLQGLRKACGYVENGSSQCISIGQDDATKWWSLSIDGKHKYHTTEFTDILTYLFNTYKE